MCTLVTAVLIFGINAGGVVKNHEPDEPMRTSFNWEVGPLPSSYAAPNPTWAKECPCSAAL